ncbi:hypothetical protein Zm00014a_021999 [Zea mays]|uniref:Uncharacterized protein n=1 Tax=Zea mays TaxID=4577 RepID=A0A3L6E181_MAIZE|nr:hypothetical protein Zm00014a_021999 [Zea mays]
MPRQQNPRSRTPADLASATASRTPRRPPLPKRLAVLVPMFGDSDGSKDASAAAPGSNPPEPPFPSRELTLSSYLCDKAPPAAAGPSSPPNPEAAAGPAEDAAPTPSCASSRICSTSQRPSAGIRPATTPPW